MTMLIKVSQLMTISLLLLVGCSGKSVDTNDSNLPGSSSNIPNDQSPSANIPTDQPAPDQNPTDSAIVGSTSVAESDISGCWVRTFSSDQDQSFFYQKISFKLELGGSYTGEWYQEIITTLTGTSSSGPHTLSGKWIIDDGYVVIQEGDRYKLTLKPISKHKLIQVGSDYPAFTRC